MRRHGEFEENNVSVVTLQGPAERGRNPQRIDLREGRSATFGACGCNFCDLDLRISGVTLSFYGEITAARSVWWIANSSDRDPLFVADVDHPEDAVVVRPGGRLPFALDMAVVTPTRVGGGTSVTVFATVVKAARPQQRWCPAITTEPTLDRSARYYAVLAELCAEAGGAMPTSADIAARLHMSPRAVDAHIDYLVKKLNLPTPARRSTGWKRTALVAHARDGLLAAAA